MGNKSALLFYLAPSAVVVEQVGIFSAQDILAGSYLPIFAPGLPVNDMCSVGGWLDSPNLRRTPSTRRRAAISRRARVARYPASNVEGGYRRTTILPFRVSRPASSRQR